MSEKPIKTCILGVGLAGLTFHAPFILALPKVFTLHAVLERNPKTPGGKVHDRFGISVRVHTTLEQVLADQEIELVIIGTPSFTHYEFAKAALEAGKHVLVDKPITATSALAKELGNLADARKLILYAYQNCRWNSDFLALRRLIGSPQYLGELVEFESHYNRYRPGLRGNWKDEPLPAGGLTYDLGSHLIDQALVLFGRPKTVTAFLQNVRSVGHPDVDDSFTIYFHYPPDNGRARPLTVILRSQALSVRSPQLRFVVRGTNGTYTKYGLDVQESQLRAMTTPDEIFGSDYGKEPSNIWGNLETLEEDGTTVRKSTWSSTEAGNYIELFKNLGAAIREGAELAVKWREATEVVEMIELAHKSSKEGVTIDCPNEDESRVGP